MIKGITSLVSFQELEFACRLATIVLQPSFLPCYLGAFHGVFLVVCSLSTVQLSRLNTYSPCVLFTVFTWQSYLSPSIPIVFFTLQSFHSLFRLTAYLSVLPFIFLHCYSPCSHISHLATFLISLQPCCSPCSVKVHLASLLFTLQPFR
jgi:hypothetical protein